MSNPTSNGRCKRSSIPNMPLPRRSVEEITDEVVDLFDRCLAQSYSRAGRELDEFRLSVAKATNEKVLLFREIGRVVLDPNVSDSQLRRIIYQFVPADASREKGR